MFNNFHVAMSFDVSVDQVPFAIDQQSIFLISCYYYLCESFELNFKAI